MLCLLALVLSLSTTLVGEPTSAGAASRLNIVLIVTDDQTMESVAHMPYVSS